MTNDDWKAKATMQQYEDVKKAEAILKQADKDSYQKAKTEYDNAISKAIGRKS